MKLPNFLKSKSRKIIDEYEFESKKVNNYLERLKEKRIINYYSFCFYPHNRIFLLIDIGNNRYVLDSFFDNVISHEDIITIINNINELKFLKRKEKIINIMKNIKNK